MTLCPCCSSKYYSQCCHPYITGITLPPTAEALMRSRYTAYTKRKSGYLLKSWHPSTRPSPNTLSLDDTTSWTGLEIVSTIDGGLNDNNGIVEFKACFVNAGRMDCLHERSRFTREDGRWCYLDGETIRTRPGILIKVGRNDPCPCGSGKKYKKCCLA